MTPEQLKKIKNFSRDWISKVVAKRKDYREKLLSVLDDIFDEENDGFNILNCKDWDWGEKYVNPDNARDTGYYSGLGDRMTELIEYDDYNAYNLTKKAKNDFICTIRIAVDLFIKQSGGVVGYTFGDLKKAFDGNIPKEILNSFECDTSKIKDEDCIWL